MENSFLTTKRKILLAILLCLVIAAAGVVIWAQEHMVYDADGTPHLDIPWQREEEQQEPQEELDLVIEEPAAPPAAGCTRAPRWRSNWAIPS